jgi:hypothetical protein
LFFYEQAVMAASGKSRSAKGTASRPERMPDLEEEGRAPCPGYRPRIIREWLRKRKGWMMRTGTLLAAAAIAAMLAGGTALAGQVVPQDQSAIKSTPTSTTQEITPYIIPPADGNDRGGNRSCADVGKAYFGNPLYYECRSDKKDYPFANSPEIFTPADGLPAECANEIEVTVTNDTFVDWISTAPVGAAIIKGGNAANTYVYEPQVTVDTGLASPPVGGGFAELSNIGGFCWNPVDQPPEECFEDDTAWAANGDQSGEFRYNPRGNWATYTEYEGEEKTVTLFAGQTTDVGTVTFSDPVDDEVEITVNLTGGWVFGVNYELDEEGNLKLDDEGNPIRDANLKVQDYATAPSGNPAPGLFMHKEVCTDSPCTIVVPENNFYGVHVDVATPVACP